MRLTTLVALLPALAAAQNQVPLGEQFKGWFEKAKSFIPSAPAADPVSKVTQKLTDKVAEKAVTPVTLENWQTLLSPSTKSQEWLVFATGGNKSCLGRCAQPEKAFNVCRSPTIASKQAELTRAPRTGIRDVVHSGSDCAQAGLLELREEHHSVLNLGCRTS